MYNAMYPAHMVVQFNASNTHSENRRYSRPPPVDLTQAMPPVRRREYGYQQPHNTHISHNEMSTVMPPPSLLNFRPLLNANMSEYWNLRVSNNHKPSKLRHGTSAPCIKTAVGESRDESSDSGLSSRSPTPSRQQPNDNKTQEVTGQGDQGSGRNYPVQNRRNDQSNHIYTKRKANNGKFPNSGHRGRRITNAMLHMSSPFPLSSLSTPYCTAPDRFLSRSHLMEIKKAPENLTNGTIWDQLSKGVWKKFIQNKQTEDTYKKKMVLWKYLYVLIKSYYPKYGLYLVGSTMSGFGSNGSDVDMCLLVRHCEIDQRSEAVSYLGDIHRLLQPCEFLEGPELIQAKVPILKFRDIKQGLEIDLNCNNAVGIRNTHLLYCYAQLDWRVRPLVLVVKLWAHHHNINDAKKMTISSYSLALMVIHFLQCGVVPVVLPCLHSMYQDKFTPNSDINSIDIHEVLPPYRSNNKQSLGELLLRFFEYFNNFEFMHFAISVRTARVIPVEECRHIRTLKNDPHQWKYLCIEEPFDLTNTARSVYHPDVFTHIRKVISKTTQLLLETRNVESIFSFQLPLT